MNHSSTPPPVHPQVEHELTDAHASPVVKFLVFLIVTSISVAGLMVLLYNFLEAREAREKTARYPLAAGLSRPLPPLPRLQTYPFQDIKGLRQEQNRLLDRYEWVDKSSGVVRIPIERAMEVLAERGLPYRKETPGAERKPAPAGAPAGQPAGAAAGAAPTAPAQPPR